MTVINALRFDRYSGVMVCDEQTTYGNFERKIDSADKIQTIIDSDIENKEMISACLGCSGTVLIAAEMRAKIKNKIKNKYADYRSNIMNSRGVFLKLDDVAKIAFESIKEIKMRHIDSIINAKYNFNIRNFISGTYLKDSSNYKIEQKEIIEHVLSLLSWKGMIDDVRYVFLNRSILAGLDPNGEFDIYSLSMIDGSMSKVQSIFQSVGSGQDISDIVFIRWSMNKTLEERLQGFEPDDGLLAIINATNAASTNNIGVGGYFNIVLFNGREKSPKKRRIEISDHRAKLSCEIASAYQFDFITREDARVLLRSLIFENSSFDEVNDRFFAKAKNLVEMQRFLRGYKRG